MEKSNIQWFKSGMKNGIPIALGYFAVAFSLGIVAKKAGITAFQAGLTSFALHASAGQYIAFTLIAGHATLLEMVIMEAIANARYMLMSCAMSQKLDSSVPTWKRLIMGYFITDEIFGVAVTVPEKLNPFYCFGMASVASPGWVLGTVFGVILGNVLPLRVVSALSVGLYGMFIAIFVPPARKNKIIAGIVAVSFALSFLFNQLPIFAGISSGIKIILLTVVISLGAAILFPVKEERQ
ncbi:MAG: AzlC family ABC transporter permease [Lachnospiraceae bacterium]|nr:AzlC family ABC transporter permease [Lachnospiraceae bacterium]